MAFPEFVVLCVYVQVQWSFMFDVLEVSVDALVSFVLHGVDVHLSFVLSSYYKDYRTV